MINKSLIRVAIYIRVSTEEQAMHGLSLEAQDAALTEYAKKNGMIIVDRYVDEGITARKKIQNRKALQRLLNDVKAGKIDMIIFTKIDRWMRNIYDYHKVQEILEQNGVHWKTIFENYDTSTATGRLHINIMLSVAQDEADRTSERIKTVFDNKVKNKKYLNQNAPFGYCVRDSVIYKDEETQHIAEDMFEKFFACNSIRGTQTYLQDKYGISFDHTSFRKIFSNTLYCGEYKGVEDFCEPYITKEQFNEIQHIMAEKHIKKTPSGMTYVFSGMLVCGKCGGRLCANYHTRNGGEQKIAAYRCGKSLKSKTCDFNKSIMEKTVEKYLFNNLLTELDKIEREYKIKKPEKKVAPSKDKAIERVKRKLSRLKDLYVNDKVEMDDYERDYNDLKKQLADLLAEPEEEEKEIDIEAIKNLLSKSTEDIYQTLTAENRRSFWRSFIDKIIVHDRDNMEIIFLEPKHTNIC